MIRRLIIFIKWINDQKINDLFFLQSAKFLDYENYDIYLPTFQVSLTKLGRVKLNLKGKGSDECVWYSNLKFPGNYTNYLISTNIYLAIYVL